MTIVYTAPLRGNEIPADRMASAGHAAIQVGHASEFLDHPGAGLYIDGGFDGFFAPLNGPLLFHCPAFTFSQLPGAPAISARFCAWPGFAERPLWEVAPQPGTEGIFMNIIVQLGLKPKIVPDIAGLIAPRILCTIINEAAFTL
ncbi:MAG TPA: hypothetical protein VK907_05370, partial [Phnomibacter sp.]|nr:hypothetical protein [Phnomibacter sp.]